MSSDQFPQDFMRPPGPPDRHIGDVALRMVTAIRFTMEGREVEAMGQVRSVGSLYGVGTLTGAVWELARIAVMLGVPYLERPAGGPQDLLRALSYLERARLPYDAYFQGVVLAELVALARGHEGVEAVYGIARGILTTIEQHAARGGAKLRAKIEEGLTRVESKVVRLS